MKNIHLEHPEDSILTGNLAVLDWFHEPKGVISVKMDGAPAIVWGRNPATGNFFVGTKSVFNKKLIKINETHSDIDRNHSGRVADILHSCFDYLPHSDWIIQGDFIGYGGSDTFHSNTLTYVFPEEVEQKIVIAPHTIYTARDDLRNAVASPLVHQLQSTDDTLFVQIDVKLSPYREDIEDVCKFAKQISTLCTFVNDKEATNLKKVLNSYIREGKEVNEYEIAEQHDCDINLIRLWKLVESIKTDLFCFIVCDKDIECYIQGEQTDHEGYVLHNEFGSFKIVNRSVFSRANFNIPKVW